MFPIKCVGQCIWNDLPTDIRNIPRVIPCQINKFFASFLPSNILDFDKIFTECA